MTNIIQMFRSGELDRERGGHEWTSWFSPVSRTEQEGARMNKLVLPSAKDNSSGKPNSICHCDFFSSHLTCKWKTSITLRPVSYFHLLVVIKYPDKKQLRGEMAYFSSQFYCYRKSRWQEHETASPISSTIESRGRNECMHTHLYSPCPPHLCSPKSKARK